MWYPATVTDAPTTEPVTAAQVKQQCGIPSSDTSYDAMIKRLIATERGYVEKYCGIKVPEQTVSVKCDRFDDFANFPIVPTQSILVSYVDVNGASQDVAPEIYELRSDGFITAIALDFGQSWPQIRRGSRISVVADVGFECAPPEIVSAILLRISKVYALSKSDPMLRKRVVEGVGSREWDTTGVVDESLNKACADLLENFRSWAAL